jgi:XTP/dITP diphosphohydrolase
VGGARRLLVATRSQHKLRELRELLALADDVELLGPDDLGIDGEPDETGRTFETNARIKARYYAARSGLPTLADDSGLEVDALGGGPGVYTRRYAGPDASDADNNVKLLRELDGLPADRRGARYVCALALALPGEAGPRGGQRLIVKRGTCKGRIATGLRGEGGFGYDPLFEPAREQPGGRTLGQWSAAEKHAISHRSRAAARMAPVLRSLGY